MIPRSVEISTQIVSHGCNAMAGEVFALQPRSWQSTQRQPPSIYSERRCADILSSSSFSPSISCCRIVAFYLRVFDSCSCRPPLSLLVLSPLFTLFYATLICSSLSSVETKVILNLACLRTRSPLQVPKKRSRLRFIAEASTIASFGLAHMVSRQYWINVSG